MKLIFAGSPQFACVALKALLSSDHTIVGVYTQPDKPAGRGLKLTPSPVKELALSHQLPVFQPTTLKSMEEQHHLKQFNADAMIVAAYGLILPEVVLSLFPWGCLNIHPSLLPRWRGAAPIQRTIYAGDKETGVTIMQMDKGLDTGAILLQKKYLIDPDDTSISLHEKLATLGAQALLATLSSLNTIIPQKQDASCATYANKISKEEALIDWRKSAMQLEQEIRAFNAWPVSFTHWQQQTLRIGFAKKIKDHVSGKTPGILLQANEEGLDICTGDGILRLLKLQLPGAKMISIADFYHAHHNKLLIGQLFQ